MWDSNARRLTGFLAAPKGQSAISFALLGKLLTCIPDHEVLEAVEVCQHVRAFKAGDHLGHVGVTMFSALATAISQMAASDV